MDGKCGTGQSGQTNTDAKSEGPSAGAPSEPARVGNWNRGRDSEWDWCGRSGQPQGQRTDVKVRRDGKGKWATATPTRTSDFLQAAGFGCWIGSTSTLNCLHLFPLASFLPSFLLAWLPWLPRRPYMKCIYKEGSQENRESFSVRKLLVFTDPMWCLLCSSTTAALFRKSSRPWTYDLGLQ